MILAQTIGSLREAWQFLSRLGYVSGIIARLIFFSAPAEVKFRLFFEQAGGAFIKLGQILALRYDILPPKYTEELLKLLAGVAPLPFPLMEQVFKEEYGEKPESFFKKFNSQPVASASISQVYRATLKSGEEVAVKIQRPGVREAFERDFVLASFLAGLIGIFRLVQAVNIHEAVEEFVIWTRRELNFRYEAQNGIALYQHSVRHPDTVIPKVFAELTRERVLVTEYMKGIARLDSVISRLDKNPNLKDDLQRQYRINLDDIAYYFIRDGLRQYFIDGFFHADPHPANVFVLSDNRLGYFDFGIMGEVGRERAELLKVIHGLANRDLTAVSRALLVFSKKSLSPDIDLFRRHKKLDHARYHRVLEKIEEIIAANFEQELATILAPWYDRESSPAGQSRYRHSTSAVFAKLLLKAEDYSVYLPREVTILFRGLIISDMVALKLCPNFDMVRALKMFFQEFPLERAIEVIEEKTHEAELAVGIDPVGHLSFEQLLELKARERERLAVVTERLSNLIIYYAERYEEVRKIL